MHLLFFIGRRVAAALPLMLGVSVATFAIMWAMPGDYVDAWMAGATAASGLSEDELAAKARQLRDALGLDRPVWVQYWLWISNIVLAGDFGLSFVHNRPVEELLAIRFERTFVIALIGLVVSQVFGVLLGLYAAANQHKLGDMLATLVAFAGVTIPKFVFAIVMLYVIVFIWELSYVGAINSAEFIFQEHFSFAKLWDTFLHVWPVILISVLVGQAFTTRMMRANVLDEMNAQYVETARAKGLSRRQTLLRHAMPNALHAVVMNIGGRFEFVVKGEIEIAIVLGIPTLGPLLVSSVSDRDLYVVGGIFLMVSCVIILGNLVADIVLAVLDPRVRRSTGL